MSEAQTAKLITSPCVGPDQVLPAKSYKTSEADGCVQLYRTDTGPSSEKPISVYSYFKKAAETYQDRPALVIKRNGEWKTWTYSEYFKDVCTVAKAFIKQGLERFHGVCIMGHNNPEWMISSLGAVFAGGLSAGVYVTNSPEACFSVADNCRAQIIVIEDKTFLDKFLAVKRLLPSIKALIQWSGEPGAPGVISWPELMAIGTHESDDLLQQRLSLAAVNQCCNLIYTSGTTGPPKGVMLSQDQITWGSNRATQMVDLARLQEVRISYLPLSHVAGQMGDMYNTLATGATVYIAPPDALKGTLGQMLLQVRPTMFLAVPRIWEKMYEKLQEVLSNASFVKRSLVDWAATAIGHHGLNYYTAKWHGRNLSALEILKYNAAQRMVFNKLKKAIGLERVCYMLSGAAPIFAEVLDFFFSLDMPIMEAYGLSESLGACSLGLIETHEYKVGSVGKVAPYNEVTLRQISDLKEGEGEVCIRGRNVFMGYLRMEQETNETIDEDRWLRTGDFGRIDHEGYMYITGRLKELVITSGGENIAPTPIENVIKKELSCISNAMLVGDNRKYLSILLTFKSEMDLNTGEPLQELTPLCQNWLRQNGSEAMTVNESMEEIRAYPDGPLARAIQEGIDKYNRFHAVSKAQRVQRWAFLPHDFSLPTFELNNTLKVKRSFVLQKYASVIDTIYSTEEKLPSKL